MMPIMIRDCISRNWGYIGADNASFAHYFLRFHTYFCK